MEGCAPQPQQWAHPQHRWGRRPAILQGGIGLCTARQPCWRCCCNKLKPARWPALLVPVLLVAICQLASGADSCGPGHSCVRPRAQVHAAGLALPNTQAYTQAHQLHPLRVRLRWLCRIRCQRDPPSVHVYYVLRTAVRSAVSARLPCAPCSVCNSFRSRDASSSESGLIHSVLLRPQCHLAVHHN